jgi:hypothetical protein
MKFFEFKSKWTCKSLFYKKRKFTIIEREFVYKKDFYILNIKNTLLYLFLDYINECRFVKIITFSWKSFFNICSSALWTLDICTVFLKHFFSEKVIKKLQVFKDRHKKN